jgi:hypothetical protein
MLPLDVSGLQHLCCPWRCLFYNSCAVPGRAFLQEPLLHLCMSVYRSFLLHLDVSVYKILCYHYVCPSTRAFMLHLDVSVYKILSSPHACPSLRAFVLNLDVSVYKGLCYPYVCPLSIYTCFCASSGRVCLQDSCATLMRVRLQELLCSTWTCLSSRALCCTWTCLPTRAIFGLFQFVSKEVCWFRLYRYRFVTPKLKQIEIIIFVHEKKPKNNRNRFSFGSFMFKPKIFFVCFEDTLPEVHLFQHPTVFSVPYLFSANSQSIMNCACTIFSLNVHKIENFCDSHFGICVISLLVKSKY